jgi:hypothetical protein
MPDLLKELMKHSTRLTNDDIRRANMQRFQGLGLDANDVQTMARSVGLEADDLLLISIHVSIVSAPKRVVGAPGRKTSTYDIALFAAEEKSKGMTWKEILAHWNRANPDDRRVKNAESLREAYRRHFAGKRPAK